MIFLIIIFKLFYILYIYIFVYAHQYCTYLFTNMVKCMYEEGMVLQKSFWTLVCYSTFFLLLLSMF